MGSPEGSPGPGTRWPDPRGSRREFGPSGREGPGLPWIDTGGTDGPVENLLQLFPTPEERWELVRMLQRLHPADAETFLQNLLPASPVSVSQTQETPRQTTQSIDTPKSIVTPQPTVMPIVTPRRDRTIAECFSCGKVGHGVSRCSEMNETFPNMWHGWSAEKVGGRYVVIPPPPPRRKT